MVFALNQSNPNGIGLTTAKERIELRSLAQTDNLWNEISLGDIQKAYFAHSVVQDHFKPHFALYQLLLNQSNLSEIANGFELDCVLVWLKNDIY